jgi:hypothetical protein
MTSGKYFIKGVKALDAPHIGHVVRETPKAVVIFGGKQERYDIPDVLIGLPFGDIIKNIQSAERNHYQLGEKIPGQMMVR